MGVCGAAAADPFLAPVLAGLGIDSLTIPAALAAVRKRLREHSLPDWRQLAQEILKAPSAEFARELATVF